MELYIFNALGFFCANENLLLLFAVNFWMPWPFCFTCGSFGKSLIAYDGDFKFYGVSSGERISILPQMAKRFHKHCLWQDGICTHSKEYENNVWQIDSNGFQYRTYKHWIQTFSTHILFIIQFLCKAIYLIIFPRRKKGLICWQDLVITTVSENFNIN